jgi:HEAT repeat protein
MTPPLEELLAILQDDTKPLPVERLSELSDLDAAGIALVQTAWVAISPERREALMGELGRLADEHFELAFERINRHALSDARPAVRRLAIQNLWECESPDLVPHLLRALTSDGTSDVRAAAAKALGSFVYLGEVEALAADYLHRIEEALLRSAREDEECTARRLALESLGFSSREEVPVLIREAYASGDEALRKSALLAMGRSANKAWGPQVLSELTSASPILRTEAAKAAGELELQEALPGLLDLLEDVNDEARRAAIWSLGQLGGTQASEALTRLIDQAEDKEEIEFLEDALENLAFVDGTRDFPLLDFDEPGGEEG